MSNRSHRRRVRRDAGTPPVTPSTELQQFSALYAAALGLLLAGLTGDSARVGTEIDRIINAGPKVTAAVLGFMTSHASDAFVHKHGNLEAAIDTVSADLAAAVLAADSGGRS